MGVERDGARAARPVSMAQVARAAGVSQQTVSRVANDLPNVSARTRERVLRAMEELGFRPNFAGKSLRSGRYNAVGLCLYDVTEFGNLATLRGILSAAREHEYAVTMVEMGANTPMSLAGASERMVGLPVDGLIVSMSIRASDFDSFRPHPGLSTVLLTVYEHPACTTVDSDQRGCSELVVDYLAGRGHREIRFVSGPAFSVDSTFRELGWREALAARGLAATEPLRGDWSADSGYEAGQVLARDERATAVYVANDQMALGVVEALRDGGRRVPEDVSVVGVDDSLGASVPHFDLTTVRFDLIARGRAAFEHVLLGSAPDYRPAAVRVPPTLVERRTVRDLR